MSYKLFLDDERFPSTALHGGLLERDSELYTNDSDWVIVRNYKEFINHIIEHGKPIYVSFDHDLADIQYKDVTPSWAYYEKTGYDCARFLVDYCIDNKRRFPMYQVHSANPIGKENIKGYIENAKKHFPI